MPDSLPSDQYYIRNEDTFAGRNRTEDRSLRPKKVYCPTDESEAQLASDLYSMAATHSDIFNLPQWELQALRNGRYRLLARGSPTGEQNRLLYAFLIGAESAEEWIITKAERQSDENRSLYTIEKADRSGGWVAQTDLEDPQIAIRPLIAAPSNPPFYPPNQLWNIQPLVD